jgi:hypothetical protein
MSGGRSIRIYLATGEVTGVRHAELVNWTGQALACPRTRFDELEAWEEVRRPGIYFLVGAEGLTEREVYIGESENVLKRIKQHIGQKEFWQEVVIFTSKDENLTKAHVRYLEHRLVQQAREIGRYKLVNGNEPAETPLPRADKAAMEEFVENLGVLIGALGHRIFVPMARSIGTSEDRFRFQIAGAEAFGAPTDEGFVIFRGSTAREQCKESMGSGAFALKAELRAQRKLIADGKLLRFEEDVLFTTPSQAGSMIAGTSCNGRVSWRRLRDGLTLKEIEGAGEVDPNT